MAEYEAIIRDGRTDGLAALTDSLPARRWLAAAAAVAPPFEGATHRTYRVLELLDRFPGVVEASLERDDGRRLQLLFRQQGERWVLTEATEDELGAPVVTERGSLQITSYEHYPYTDEIVGAVEDAAERVRRFFGTLSQEQLRVRLKPATGVGPQLSFDVQAVYQSGRRPGIVINVPWSLAFRPAAEPPGWVETVRQLVAHELTHAVLEADPSFAAVNKAPGWLAEGVAEYVAAPLRLEQSRTIEERDGWLPLEATNEPSLLALDAAPPSARLVGYIQAQLLVTYLTDGDPDRLRAFANAYAGAPGTGAARLRTALQQDRGIPLETFLSDWRSWVQRQVATSVFTSS
jgi:hypothetical protein